MSSATQTDDMNARTSRILWALGLLLLVAGWLSILHVYRWHFTASVFFLWMGWAAMLLTTRFLARAGLAAAEDTGDGDDEEFWRPAGERDELLIEKRALLKAIKEIEFDHEMGKMSDADAAELTRFYRRRAIEVIKALEAEGEDDGALSVQERIDREVKARLAVARTGAKGKARAGGRARQAADEEAEAESAEQAAAGKAEAAEREAAEEAPAVERAEEAAEKAEAAAGEADAAEEAAEDTEQAEPEARAAGAEDKS